MRSAILLVLFLSVGSLFAQELNKTIVDPQLEREVLIGKCDREGLNSDLFVEHFNREYNAYNPDKNAVKELRRLKKGVDMVIVMGSWCSDSQEQVPRFYKILDEIKYKDSQVELISVDRAKTGGEYDVSGFDIKRVPTFIFYKNERELGRITESPSTTLEKDMLLILMQGS